MITNFNTNLLVVSFEFVRKKMELSSRVAPLIFN